MILFGFRFLIERVPRPLPPEFVEALTSLANGMVELEKKVNAIERMKYKAGEVRTPVEQPAVEIAAAAPAPAAVAGQVPAGYGPGDELPPGTVL